MLVILIAPALISTVVSSDSLGKLWRCLCRNNNLSPCHFDDRLALGAGELQTAVPNGAGGERDGGVHPDTARDHCGCQGDHR